MLHTVTSGNCLLFGRLLATVSKKCLSISSSFAILSVTTVTVACLLVASDSSLPSSSSVALSLAAEACERMVAADCENQAVAGRPLSRALLVRRCTATA